MSNPVKRALVCGAGGFIGGHMVRRLLDDGYAVTAVDIKPLEEWYQVFNRAYSADRVDLTMPTRTFDIFWEANDREEPFTEIYQLAADMGGAGYIFTGENDADIMHNSAMINLNIARMVKITCPHAKVFFSSSACVYPEHNQTDPNNPNCEESTAYPANPDSEYGWEKIFSERLWRSYARNHGLNVRIARFHNIFGPCGTWTGGKEKAPAAMCPSALEAEDTLEVWGPGTQTRSFLYIEECIEGVRRLMESDVTDVVNIGSDEMISINNLARMALDLAGREDVEVVNVDGPVGVMGRCSDNDLIFNKLGWRPMQPLRRGMEETLLWIEEEMNEIK